MLIEETKRTVSMHPITLLVCFMCVIGLSVAATYFIVHAGYKKQSDNKDKQILAAQKINKALKNQNIELQNSLQKLKNEYSKLGAQLSEIEALKTDRQTLKEKNNGSREIPASRLVLKPTWVSSGETILAFDGNLRIVLYKASDKDKCQKTLAAVSYLISAAGIKKLCLRTGRPEEFTYQGNQYLFNLSGIAEKASVYRYCISISSER